MSAITRPATPLVCISLALLGACTVGPSFQRAEPAAPAQFRIDTDDEEALASRYVTGEVDAQWWGQFGDPLLLELVEQARRSSPDIQLAALRVAQSRVQREAAAGARAPQVTAGMSYRRQRQSELGTGTRLIDAIGVRENREAIIEVLSEPHDVYQAGFDTSWELDLWGRVRRAVEAADASLAASTADLEGAQLSLVAEVARTYFELRGVQAQLRLAQEDVALSERALELTQARAAGGLVTQLDVVSQRARLASVRASLPELQQSQRQLIAALALLLDAPPGALDDRLAEARPVPAPPAQVAIGVPAEVARRRPDIRSAEARLHAATAQIGVAVADFYPRITLTGGFLQETLEAGDLGEWAARQWTVGPSLRLPIFDGGRRRATLELRKLQQQEAAVIYHRGVLRAWHEIDTALSAYLAEQRRNRELADAAAAAREAHELARVRYEHGLTSFLIALDAQRTLLQAQREYEDSRARIDTQLVALYKALGGGWTP